MNSRGSFPAEIVDDGGRSTNQIPNSGKRNRTCLGAGGLERGNDRFSKSDNMISQDPVQVPIRPWMKMELVRKSNIASRATTEKKVKVTDVSVEVLSKILGFIGRFNPDRSPHKYEVSPSKPVPDKPPLPPTSQAPPLSPLHLESSRTADASDLSRSRHKRHRLSFGSVERSKYEVSPSKPVPNKPSLPPTSQAPRLSPLHLDSS